jgi:hypothetical protein
MTTICSQMEDDLNSFKSGKQLQSLKNGRWPQYWGKWKINSIFFQREDDPNFLEKGRQPQLSGKWKKTKRFGKWKTTSISRQMKDHINIFLNRVWPWICNKKALNFFLGTASLASPSLTGAWHSSAPACFFYFVIHFIFDLLWFMLNCILYYFN